jgi:biotin-(acetyl-CoA carboxylase) ligase
MPLLTDGERARSLFARTPAEPREADATVAPATYELLTRNLFADVIANRSVWRDEPALGDWLLVREHASESQFVKMQQLLEAGERLPDRLLAVAMAGDRFVGQRGRSWSALPGNLHLSAHYRIDRPAAALQVPLSLWPAVAAARAIERSSAGELRPETKWVNDLLLAGRKVAGVLVHSNVRQGTVGSVLIGIGINVARAPELPVGERQVPPGALATLAQRFAEPDAWVAVLHSLLGELEATRAVLLGDAPQVLFDDYRQRACFLGRRVHVWPVDGASDGPPLASGRVLDLLPDLGLVIAGVAEPVRTGRMTLDPTPEDDLLWNPA